MPSIFTDLLLSCMFPSSVSSFFNAFIFVYMLSFFPYNSFIFSAFHFPFLRTSLLYICTACLHVLSPSSLYFCSSLSSIFSDSLLLRLPPSPPFSFAGLLPLYSICVFGFLTLRLMCLFVACFLSSMSTNVAIIESLSSSSLRVVVVVVIVAV